MKSNLKVFEFGEKNITFDLSGGKEKLMVNATEMAKPFGKAVADFTKIKQTKDFIQVLENQRHDNPHIADNEVIRVFKGGDINGGGGTWFCKKLALKFAAWLSPQFESWVYDRIDELFRHGGTVMNPEDLLDPDFIVKLATELKKERAEKRKVMEEKERVEKDLFEAAPKAVYTDEVLQRQGLLPISTIGQDYGLTLNYFILRGFA